MSMRVPMRLLTLSFALVMAGTAVEHQTAQAQSNKPAAQLPPSRPASAQVNQPQAAQHQAAQQIQSAQPQAAQPQAAPQQAAQQQPSQPPQPYRTEILNFDNWNVTCREFAEGKHKRVCFAQLQIIQQNNNQVVFSWTIGFDDENRQLMSLQTPTGVAITPGVDLKLSKGNRTVPYASCETGHCIATLPMEAVLVHDLMATAEAQAVIHSSDGRDVQVNIPMKGFDKAYAALSK